MRLTRRSTIAALGGGLAAPWVRPASAQGGALNVYNWADYIGETTLEDFGAEFGVDVVYDNYASAEEMQARMLAGMTGYDVVFSAGVFLPRAIPTGILDPIDRSRLSNWGNLDPEILRILDGWDAGNRYGVPYMWGSVGFTYNVDMVRERLPEADLEDLATVFDPENAAKLADCGISILDSPDDIMLTVLRHLGLDGDTTDPADYARVAEAFAPIRPHIRAFDNNNYLNAIPNGELCVVNSWSGDYATAAARAAEAGVDLELAYAVPRTGAPAWIDVMAIPADAGNKDNAYLFIDYMLRPEVAAAATNYTHYANANSAADAFVDPAVLADPAIYPDAEIIARMWAPQPRSDELDRELLRVWQAIKAG